ncbi:hypothetical protein FSP39_018060 [Pinctada imbricata]|uniref:Uncharacterized protein n=1 Tax=Pinctada imbricata TaxID=66713 RepID=A0AA88YHR7_PINIB|nr:hypothetical protein FSP39_018060 [Pinctada imbricata]
MYLFYVLRMESWEGIVNSKPSAEQYSYALTQKDLLISGQLEAHGKLEATGTMMYYFMAGGKFGTSFYLRLILVDLDFGKLIVFTLKCLQKSLQDCPLYPMDFVNVLEIFGKFRTCYKEKTLKSFGISVCKRWLHMSVIQNQISLANMNFLITLLKSVLFYLSPCVVSNLWDVTDKDIDRFLRDLLETWLENDSSTDLLDIIPKARDVCRLKYLIGSAPVVYGLPITLNPR